MFRKSCREGEGLSDFDCMGCGRQISAAGLLGLVLLVRLVGNVSVNVEFACLS